ncbi:hypothetical protein [Burkholderia sp. JP2-270]|uniref:hypothetical protein n=1 Tax=Burkholderia sp. JP2-270 TaxID=2217913 RepID=UPI0013A6A000|nr:hypothetical protein [Burkholderia sp. JP2-270]
MNRDMTNTNGTVAKLPDMQNLLSNQADMMAAASAAGEAVSRRIADYADKMMKDAAANGDKAGVDAWKEGGANRALMQGAGAALVTGLAGGNAVGGAAGAAIASIASGKLNELSRAIAGSDPTGNANMNQALGNRWRMRLRRGLVRLWVGSRGRSRDITSTGSIGSCIRRRRSGSMKRKLLTRRSTV